MKKLLASTVSLMLVISMFFSAAPTAFADELLPQDIPPVSEPIIQSSAPAIEAAPQAVSSSVEPTPPSESTVIPDAPDANIEPDVSSTAVAEATPEQAPADTLVQDSLLLVTTTNTAEDVDNLDAATVETTSIIGGIIAVIKLENALDDLFKSIQSASGPTIMRTDEGSDFTIDDTTAHFQEGSYYTDLSNVLDSINSLMKELGIESDYHVSSLPISEIEKLPPGFSFENNTLTLDPEFLRWSPELGDEEDARYRSYQIELQLSTGISYVDKWLSKKGINNLASQKFDIRLLLIRAGTPPIDDTKPPIDDTNPPIDDTNPPIDEGEIAPPGNEGTTPGNGGGGNSGSAAIALVATNTATGASNIVGAVVPSVVTGMAGDTNETPTATQSGSGSADSPEVLKNIEDQQIPMASVMLDNNGNIAIANAALVILSLLLSAVSLVALRQLRKPDTSQVTATAQPNQIGQILGAAGAVLGASSAILTILSHYLVDSPANSNTAWTPVLIAILAVQAACAVGLFFIIKAAQKKPIKPRYNIRL